MKVFGIILLVLVVAGVAVYVDGARLPYDHSVSVTGVVAAPPKRYSSSSRTSPMARPGVLPSSPSPPSNMTTAATIGSNTSPTAST